MHFIGLFGIENVRRLPHELDNGNLGKRDEKAGLSASSSDRLIEILGTIKINLKSFNSIGKTWETDSCDSFRDVNLNSKSKCVWE